MRLLFFEHRSEPVLKWAHFIWRLIANLAFGILLVVLSLIIGMIGYHYLESLSWVDSFINAAMILSGMGPLWQPQNYWGKIFAGMYALYSGLAVIVIAGITFAPMIHRFLHVLHVDEENGDERP